MSAQEEFTVVPLKILEDDEHGHHLFVKENVSKITSKQKPNGRTLYILNVPPYATEESLRQSFSLVGPVEKVVLQEKPASKESKQLTESATNLFRFKVAYVVFEKIGSLKKILKSKKIHPLNNDGQLLTGVDKWSRINREKRPDHATLRQEIDKYMQSYDAKEEEKKKQESANEVDEDGWVTVSKKNAGVFSQKLSVVKKLEDKLDNDRSTKELKNFYTFQIRESKKNDIISLRKKYDRDLKKMEQIKKTKRFKPY